MADNWRTHYDATNSRHFAEGYLLDVSRRRAAWSVKFSMKPAPCSTDLMLRAIVTPFPSVAGPHVRADLLVGSLSAELHKLYAVRGTVLERFFVSLGHCF